MGLNGPAAVDAIDFEGEGQGPSLFSGAPQSVGFNKLRKRLLRQVRQALDDFSRC
jgi:tRNA 2-thiocytidine biosynthesis protein TtcA